MDTIGSLTTAISIIPKLLQQPAISLELNGWVPRDEKQKIIDADGWDLWVAISSKNPTSEIVRVDTEFEYKFHDEKWVTFDDWDLKDRYLLPGQGFYFPKKISEDRIDKDKLHLIHQSTLKMSDIEYIEKRTELLVFRIGATAKYDKWYLKCRFKIPKMRYFFDFRRLVLIPWFKKDSQFID